MRITSSEDFGKTIKRRRKALGYTQAYLAEFTGFSTSFISNLENGKETAFLNEYERKQEESSSFCISY